MLTTSKIREREGSAQRSRVAMGSAMCWKKLMSAASRREEGKSAKSQATAVAEADRRWRERSERKKLGCQYLCVRGHTEGGRWSEKTEQGLEKGHRRLQWPNTVTCIQARGGPEDPQKYQDKNPVI